VYRSADPKHDITVFDYCASRSGEHPRRFLGDWRGALMVDDFGGYKALFPAIIELGCWAHARRKFVELVESKASTRAEEILEPIAQLYRVETEAKNLTPRERQVYRQRHAAPVLARIRTWLVGLRPTVADGSGLARAIDYTLRRWSALVRYLQDGRYVIGRVGMWRGRAGHVLRRSVSTPRSSNRACRFSAHGSLPCTRPSRSARRSCAPCSLNHCTRGCRIWACAAWRVRLPDRKKTPATT
jgi:hypothetical protein